VIILDFNQVFNLTAFFTSPFMLMFATVALGLCFGQIRFGKFSFGTSGALFVGLFISWLAYYLGSRLPESSPSYAAVRRALDSSLVSSQFFDLFLVIFVAAVGLHAARDILIVVKKYGPRFIVLAVLTVTVGFLATYGLTLGLSSGGSVSPFRVSGVLTGALTSSPGLAAALETAGAETRHIGEKYQAAGLERKQKILDAISPHTALNAAEIPALTDEQVVIYAERAAADIGVGHAVSYPFGVLIVILAMNFFPKIFRMNIDEEWERYRTELYGDGAEVKEKPEGKFSIPAFFFVAVIGYFVGGISIPLGPVGDFSLGSTGGVLIMALVIGCIGKIGPLNFRMEEKPLVFLRELGLSFFLAIVGLRYGGEVVKSLAESGVMLILVAVAVASASALFSLLLGRYVFKINWILLSGAICGAMTATPGLGAAVDSLKSDKPAAGYGTAYPFGLLMTVICCIILHKLPM
jgi:putative transport protein